ncbi:MAG: FMN-binding protein [Bacilli bacterium]
MFKKLDPKINLALTLAIISGISALLLALVNNLTSPVIAQNRQEQTLNLYSEIFPDMTDYEEFSSDNVDSVLTINKDGEELGTICVATGRNSYGSVTALVGFDLDNNIVGIQYSNFSQTPGFGDKVKDQNYVEEQYVGDSASSIDADTASGATYSSKLVFELSNKCAAEVEE